MKNIRLYTFAVLFADVLSTYLHPKKIAVYNLYRKSRDKLASSDVKLSSRMRNASFDEMQPDHFIGDVPQKEVLSNIIISHISRKKVLVGLKVSSMGLVLYIEHSK